MGYLPTNASLFVMGGRNDAMCKTTGTPFLNDIWLYLLDQKQWINVKYATSSERIDFVGNHCMSIISDGDQYEKILVFGGISNRPGPKKEITDVESFLSNQTYIISVQQKNSNTMKFKGKKNDEGDQSNRDMSAKILGTFTPTPGGKKEPANTFTEVAQRQ